MKKKNKIHGFTLIELLIVVAIIAILAAIAIPNFLAAQIRAKVSEIKGNARTLATGVESYYVDYNEYPPCQVSAGAFTWAATPQVTTPISYLSSLPKDVFDVYAEYGPRGLPIKYSAPGPGFSGQFPISYSWTDVYIRVPEDFPGDNGTYIQYGGGGIDYKNSPVRYAIWSVGPDSDYEANQPVPMSTWYDPTNGTVSNGNIVRLSTGHGN